MNAPLFCDDGFNADSVLVLHSSHHRETNIPWLLEDSEAEMYNSDLDAECLHTLTALTDCKRKPTGGILSVINCPPQYFSLRLWDRLSAACLLPRQLWSL